MINSVFILIGAIVLLACVYLFATFRKEERCEFGIISKRITLINNVFHFLIFFFLIGYISVLFSLNSKEALPSFDLILSQILFWGSVFVAVTIIMLKIMLEYIVKAKLNQIDHLTGLNNKISGSCKIDDILLECKYPVYLSVLDLDNFKALNDIYGHLIGDEVLVDVAKFIKKYINSEEVASRFGGDEFVIAFCNRSEDEVITILENIKKDIKNISEKYKEANFSVSVGLSFGVGKGAGGSTTYKDLMMNADKALYHVKKNGKGAIHVFSEDVIHY
ncbi:MAG: GGDEF domain-containing protein [Pleomorphochaeta sp.]